MFSCITWEQRISLHINYITLNTMNYIKMIHMIALCLRQLWHDVILEFYAGLALYLLRDIEDIPLPFLAYLLIVKSRDCSVQLSGCFLRLNEINRLKMCLTSCRINKLLVRPSLILLEISSTVHDQVHGRVVFGQCTEEGLPTTLFLFITNCVAHIKVMLFLTTYIFVFNVALLTFCYSLKHKTLNFWKNLSFF